MTPTFEMLTFQLSKYWDIQIIDGHHKSKNLPLPKIFDPAIPPERDQCIIAKADDLHLQLYPISNLCVICCNGDPPNYYHRGECSLIIVDPSVSVIQVHNRVQEIYLLYQKWYEYLHDLLMNNVSMQDILDICSPVLENTLVLTDENHNMIAASQKGNIADIPDPTSAVFSSDAKITVIDKNQIYLGDHFFNYETRNLRIGKEAPSALFIRFYLENKHIATLSMVRTDHTLGKHDQQLIENLASIIFIQLLRPAQLESKYNQELIISLFKGSRIEESDLQRLESLLFHDPSDSYRCIILKLPRDTVMKSGIYLIRRIKIEASASFAVIFKDQLIAIINESKCHWDEHRFYTSIKGCLGQTKFIAAISDSFSSLEDLHYYYKQAKSITDISDYKQNHILSMMDCWEPFILTNCRNGLPPEMLYPLGLKQLIKYDNTSNVDYIETLRAYIEEGLNDSRTAARLFISRNTFLYRLKKIESIIGSDLKDPDFRFHLELSLRLIKWSQK